MIPDDRCECCGKYKAYRDGMCWGCRAVSYKTEAEFLTAESIKQGHEPQSTQPGDGLTKTHRKPI